MQPTLVYDRQAIASAGITTAAALFAMAASPLMPVKAYALFAGMAVLATALLATTLFPPVRSHRGKSPEPEVQQRSGAHRLHTAGATYDAQGCW